jgi:hypothetical protein
MNDRAAVVVETALGPHRIRFRITPRRHQGGERRGSRSFGQEPRLCHNGHIE